MFKNLSLYITLLWVVTGVAYGQSVTPWNQNLDEIIPLLDQGQSKKRINPEKSYSKLGTHLGRLHSEYQAFLKAIPKLKSKRFLSQDMGLRQVGRFIPIEAIAKENSFQLLSDLENLGLEEGIVAGRHVAGLFPIHALGHLDQLQTLKFVQPGYIVTNQGLICSRGDIVLGTDDVRNTLGFDGTGVTVGVISDSYDVLGGAATDVSTGDLPANVNVVLDRANGTDEGRAMLQIVHDIAPGADLAFHTSGNSQAIFAQGIYDLANQANADVIVDDILNVFEPMFQDGIIAQAAEDVIADGVSFFSAAGNSAGNSYESQFVNSGVTGVFGEPTRRHDFDPGPGVDDLLTITLAAGSNGIQLQWDDPIFSLNGAPGAASDLDLIFYTIGGAFIQSISLTDFNVGNDPIEGIGFNVNNAIQVQIGVEWTGGAQPGFFKLHFTNNNTTIDEYFEPSSTIVGHANAENVIAVGAAAWFNTPPINPFIPNALIEPFSSFGNTPIFFAENGNPVNEVRLKPDVVASNRVNTTFFGTDLTVGGLQTTEPDGFPNFAGTSAAAPHAAAVAALLLDANPNLTPRDIFHILASNANDMNDLANPASEAGYDNRSGWGFIDGLSSAQEAVGYPGTEELLELTFDQASGDFIYDRSGFYNHATYTGGVQFVPGLLGNAVELDGSTGYVVVEHTDQLLTNEGTISLWFNAHDLNFRQNLVSKDAKFFLTGGHFNLWLDGDDEIEVRLQSNSQSFKIHSHVYLQTNTWNHLAFTFGANGMRLYLNGQQIGHNSYTGGLSGNQEPLALGVNTWASDPLSLFPLSSSFFDGLIDNFTLFNRALTPSEISALANP